MKYNRKEIQALVRVLQDRYGLRKRRSADEAIAGGGAGVAAESDAPQPEQVAFRW